MSIDHSIERLIRDYFNGQLSQTEEFELIGWLKLKEENRAYFFQYKDNLDPQKIEHPLLPSSYFELKSKLFIDHQFNSKLSGQFRRMQYSYLRIAAMLFFALLTGFSLAYLFMEKKTQKTEVVWFETQVPRGKKSQILLPDGSHVWVNSESNVSYPSNFMDGNREIKLKGEAYFEVAKYGGKLFIVKTNDYDIVVLGTKFNVTAYSDFDRTETSLIEGKIEIQKGEQTFSIAPGEQLTYASNQFSVRETNTSKTTSWKDDIFDFDQITFKELVIRLQRWYDVDIDIKNPELEGILYSGIFKNEETIWQVLNTFQLTLPIRYTRVGFRKFVIEINK